MAPPEHIERRAATGIRGQDVPQQPHLHRRWIWRQPRSWGLLGAKTKEACSRTSRRRARNGPDARRDRGTSWDTAERGRERTLIPQESASSLRARASFLRSAASPPPTSLKTAGNLKALSNVAGALDVEQLPRQAPGTAQASDSPGARHSGHFTDETMEAREVKRPGVRQTRGQTDQVQLTPRPVLALWDLRDRSRGEVGNTQQAGATGGH